MSMFGKRGVRCDWCGKISNNKYGEYLRPVRNASGDQLAGYIRMPEWERENDQGRDICQECAANLCPTCGSDQIVKVTPATPGSDGWGGRCKACDYRWTMPTSTGESHP